MNEAATLITFAVFALVCIWWFGNLANNLRKQNSELVKEMIDLARNTRLDRATEPTLPDYIPMDPQSGVEGGFYKQADGTWMAALDGSRHYADSPLGGGRATTETVEGVFPSSDDLDLEDEA